MEEFIGYIEAYDIDNGEATRPDPLTGDGQESARFPALNPNAWVLAHQGWHHICNNRSLYTSLDEIEPNPTFSRFGKTGDLAVGIGTIRLAVGLKDGQTLRLPFNEVLFVPTRKTNSLSLKRLLHSGTAIDHRTGFAYDSNDRLVMWFPDSGEGLPTLRLAGGLPDSLYLANELTDDERSAAYCDAWIKQQPVVKAINGFADALRVLSRLRESSARADPGLTRRLLAKKVVNVTVEDLVKLLGIHSLAPHHHPHNPQPPHALAHSSPSSASRACSTPGARQPLSPRNSALSPARTSLPATMKRLSETKSEFIKKQWGSRFAFQSAYGLKMTPEDIVEGDAILDRLRRAGLFR